MQLCIMDDRPFVPRVSTSAGPVDGPSAPSAIVPMVVSE